MKKILYIIPRFHPFKGGAEKNIEELAVRIAENGFKVEVLTTNVKFKDEKLLKEENYKGLKIIRLWVLNKLLNLGFWPELLPRIIFNKYDFIHSSGFGFVWVEICLILYKIFNPKVNIINTPHGPFLATNNSSLFRKTIKSIFDTIYSFILPKIYNKVIAVVPNQKKWLGKIYKFKPEQIHFVPNGINSDYIEKNKPEIKSTDTIVITYVNRIEKYKGIQDILYAISKLKNEYRNETLNIKFKILGRSRKGDYKETLVSIINKNKINEFVEFIDSPTDELRDYILKNESQINILPSEWEATGIVLIEAMAKGNVIITTKQNEACDILINDTSGFLYNFGDVDELTKILDKLIKNYPLRKKIIVNNLKYSKNFTWESAFNKYIKLFSF